MLITLNSLVELISTLLHGYRAAFELDLITLVLVDPAYEVRHILEDEGMALADQPEMLFLEDSDRLDALFGVSGAPVLGGYQPGRHGEFFFVEPKPASVAMIPLTRYGELIGSLNFASHRLERFVEGSATDFLQGLASVVAICLENAINHERLKRVGLTDFLTAVNNRRFFDQRLGEEISRAQRSGQPLACLLLDVDNFKKVNDTHGHRAGDIVLKELATLVRRQLRTSDVLARFGGEEFVVLLINSPERNACEVAERIRAELEAHAIPVGDGVTLSVTASIGMAQLQGATRKAVNEVAEHLVDAADQALYRAKHGGKNQVVNAGRLAL